MRRLKSRQGFTLIEITIAAAILSVVTLGVFEIFRWAVARQEAAALDSEARASIRELLGGVRKSWKGRLSDGGATAPFVALPAGTEFTPVGASPCQSLQINQVNSVAGIISPGVKSVRFATQCLPTQNLSRALPDLRCANSAVVDITTTRPGVAPTVRRYPTRLEGLSVALCFRVGPAVGGVGFTISVEAGAFHRGRPPDSPLIEAAVLSTNDRQGGIEFFD